MIGTPGGDAGEFLLGVSALEMTLGKSLTPEQIEGLFDRYLHDFGRFYLHSDEHAAEHFAEHFDLESHEPPKVEAWLRHPPRELEQKTLQVATQSEFVGCGDLKLMLLHPEEYSARLEVVRQLLTLFFKRMWSHPSEVEFVILHGEHHEEAVLDIRMKETVRSYSFLPRVPPRVGEHQIFVLHSDVAAFLRANNAHFFVDRLHLNKRDEKTFTATISKLAETQLARTSALSSAWPADMDGRFSRR